MGGLSEPPSTAVQHCSGFTHQGKDGEPCRTELSHCEQAESLTNAENRPPENIGENRRLANRLQTRKTGQHVHPAHKSACRSLGYALTRSSFDGWDAHAAILAARLTPAERAANAWAALRSLAYRHARDVSAAVLDRGPNFPPPIFDAPMAVARHWVKGASRDERKAYLVACYDELTPEDQAAFLAHVQRGASV